MGLSSEKLRIYTKTLDPAPAPPREIHISRPKTTWLHPDQDILPLRGNRPFCDGDTGSDHPSGNCIALPADAGPSFISQSANCQQSPSFLATLRSRSATAISRPQPPINPVEPRRPPPRSLPQYPQQSSDREPVP